METLQATLTELLGGIDLMPIVRAALVVLAGLLLARVLGRVIVRGVSGHLGNHQTQLLRRATVYIIVAIFGMLALNEAGFELSLLLGAAGVLTIAVGFASQTSAANVVSGLFLLGEGSFGLGDVIRIGTTTGEVHSIDLLSVKLRTFDNLLVRIPNETLIKSELTNLSRFDIRRMDMPISVAYRQDLDRVVEVLIELADAHPLALEEPRPIVIVTGYKDSGVGLQYSVWAARSNFLTVRNELYALVRQRFAEEQIEIPFPQVALHAGTGAAPIAVELRPGTPERTDA